MNRDVAIGDVCDVVNGATPKTKTDSFWGGDVQWITPAEMGGLASPYLGSTKRTLTDEGLASCSAQLLPSQSIILSSRAPIGHLVINTEPMATNQGCKGLVPNSDLDPKFLFYFLRSIRERLNDLGSGTTFLELSATKLRQVRIPLPPLDEQRRIVAKLDDATDFVSKATEAVGVARSEADALRSQILNKAFGQRVGDAPSMELKDVCRFINGRAYKKTEFLDSGPYPVLRVGNFFTNANRVYSDLELDSEKYCEAGDLLYAWSASFGPRLWAGPKAIFHYHIWKVVPNESLVLKDYLFRLLQWDVAQIRNDHGTGATMMHVTKGNMEARTVRIPALADQRAICAEVAAADLEMDALDRALAKKSSELGALLPAILNDLIAG